MKTVGIIGGLGPETTSEFYLDIVFSCQKKSKTSRPGVIIASVPLPYKIEEDLITKNKGSERYIPFLVNEAKRLEKAGADFIVMPCNSLHVFIKEIRNAVDIPVLSIIEETVKFLKKNNLNNVGLPNALTGPISRGDLGTVRKHISALKKRTPSLLSTYKELGLQTIPIALAKGKIDRKKADALSELLGGKALTA